MRIIKELEQIAKENNVSLKDVAIEFNKYNKEFYDNQYGTFLQQVSCWAIDSVRENYNK